MKSKYELSKVLKIENDHLEKRAYAFRCCKNLAYIIYIILSFYYEKLTTISLLRSSTTAN